jgi:signal peptidase
MPHGLHLPAVHLPALHLPVVSPRARRIAFAIRVLITGLIGLGVLLSVSIFVLSATGTARLVPVLSDSMAPNMPVGSMALTVPVPESSIVVGDVIVFSNPNRPSTRVIHRVTHIFGPDEADQFSNWSPDVLFATTKGDNNPMADPWVVAVADATVWRMETSVPVMGFPAIWLGQPLAPIWLLGAGMLAVVAGVLRAVWRRPRAHVASASAPSAPVTPAAVPS